MFNNNFIHRCCSIRHLSFYQINAVGQSGNIYFLPRNNAFIHKQSTRNIINKHAQYSQVRISLYNKI